MPDDDQQPPFLKQPEVERVEPSEGEVVAVVRAEGEQDGQRLAPQEPKFDDYPEETKLRAQIYFTAGAYPSLSQIAEALGVSAAAVRYWKERKEPNGCDWDEQRDAFAQQQWYILSDAAHESGAEEAARLVVFGRMLREAAMEALTVGTLYDAEGNPVEFLYNSQQKKVLVGGIKPKSATELSHLVTAITKLTDMRDREVELREEKERLFVEVMSVLHEIIHAVELTPAQQERYRQKVEGLKVEGRLPRALGEGPEKG